MVPVGVSPVTYKRRYWLSIEGFRVMQAFYTALIPMIPALTALIWTAVQELRHRREVTQRAASQTANTGAANVRVLPSEQQETKPS